MGSIDLIVADGDLRDLDSFAARFLGVIDAQECERRESVNYANGLYYLAKSNTLRIKLCYTDDSDHSDRPFWAMVEGELLSDEQVERMVNLWACQLLSPFGFELAQVNGFGTKNEVRRDYGSDGKLIGWDDSGSHKI